MTFFDWQIRCVNDCIVGHETNAIDIFSRVLLRIRMLDYLKHGVIGEFAQQVLDGVSTR